MWKLQAAGLGLMLALMCVAPLTVHAHATPTTYEPAAGSTELEVPASITIRFTERIEMGASSLTVFAPDGSKVNQGKGALVANEDRVFSVPITDAGEGVYTVSWQVVSVDDGHFTKGAFSFLVDSEGTEYVDPGGGTVEVAYSSDPKEAVFGFVSLIGESIFVAALLFLLLLLRPIRAGTEQEGKTISESLLRSYTHAVSIGFLLFASAGVIAITKKSIELAMLQQTLLSEAALAYLSSSVGTFAALKVVAAFAFFLVWIIFRKKLLDPSWPVFGLLGTVLFAILAMQSYVSHATASLFLPELSIMVTFVHLAAKEFIVGGLLLVLIASVLLLAEHPKAFARIAARFDLCASWALLFAGVSGAYVTWLHLKGFENIKATDWGELFIVLLFATALLGGFRMWHQLLADPRLHEVRIRMMVPVTLALECTLGLCVLFISGYIAITTPPFTVEEFEFKQTAVSEGVQIDLEVHPYEHDMFRITLRNDESNEPIDTQSLTVTAFNSGQNIGPNVLQTNKRFQGGYVFHKTELSPAGEWEIDIHASQSVGYDAQGKFTLQYPEDIVQSSVSNEVRTFDAFGAIMVFAGLGIVAFSGGLIWYAKRQIILLEESTRDYENKMLPTKLFISGWFFAVVLLILLVYGWHMYLRTEFEKNCIAAGHTWVQALPAREHTATAPNAVLGCTLHMGHYHFADMREYEEFMSTQ